MKCVTKILKLCWEKAKDNGSILSEKGEANYEETDNKENGNQVENSFVFYRR